MKEEIFLSHYFQFPSYEEGELIFQEKDRITLSGEDKYLVSALVEEEKSYEVELLKPFTKGQKSTCDCGSNSKKSPCRHVIAVLLQLSKERQLQRIERENSKKEKPEYLSLKLILEQTDEESLKYFIRDYAKKDTRFNHAFKVHFASKVNTRDNAAKYRSVLNNLIKPVTKVNMKPGIQQIREFLHAGSDLLGQLHDMLVLEEVHEALNVLKAFLTKGHYVLFHGGETLKEEQVQMLDMYYIACREMLTDDEVAPEIKKEIHAFLNELIHLSYYTCPSSELNAYLLLYNHTEANKKDLLEEIKDQVQKNDSPQVLQHLYYCYHIIHNGDDVSIENRHISLQLPVFQKMVKNGYLSKAIRGLLSVHRQTGYQAELTDLLIHLYLKTSEVESAISVATEAFLLSHDLYIIDRAKKSMEGEDFRTLTLRIEKRIKDSRINPNAFGYYLLKTDNYEALLQFLEEQRDLQMLLQFDVYLYPEHKKQIKNMYKEFIKNYSAQVNASLRKVFFQEILHHLQRIGAHDIRSELSLFMATLHQSNENLHNLQ